MKNNAIIVAGGTGNRMQSEIPKQFLTLGGKMILQYSIDVFYAFDPSISLVLVVHPGYRHYVAQLRFPENVSPVMIADGGETRFDSVKNGLSLLNSGGLVAVHDAARPLITVDLLKTLFTDAAIYGNAVPGVHISDTVRMMGDDDSRQIDRSMLRAMQTPQVFDVEMLKKAYCQPYSPAFTDDAMVMQTAGNKLHISEGLIQNIKITNPVDLLIASALLTAD